MKKYFLIFACALLANQSNAESVPTEYASKNTKVASQTVAPVKSKKNVTQNLIPSEKVAARQSLQNILKKSMPLAAMGAVAYWLYSGSDDSVI